MQWFEKLDSLWHPSYLTDLLNSEVVCIESGDSHDSSKPFYFLLNQKVNSYLTGNSVIGTNLDNVFNKLPRPDISLEEAVEQGQVSEQEVTKMYESSDDQPVELFFDDTDLLIKDKKKSPILDDLENEDVEIDGLLDDEDISEPSFDEKNDDIKKITSPLKISDDDPVNIDDED